LIWVLLVHAETLFESVNTSSRVYKLLLTGIERMALRADFNLDILFCRTSLDYVTAMTNNCCLVENWMNSLFHNGHLFFQNLQTIVAHRFINVQLTTARIESKTQLNY